MKNKLSFLVLAFGLFLTTNSNAQVNWTTNTVNPTSSALGGGNTVAGETSTVVGTQNNMNLSTKRSSFIAGHRNTVNNSFSFALGMSNAVQSTQSGAFGVNNYVDALNSFAIGHSNRTSGSFSFAFGHSNKASGAFSFAIGRNTVNTKNYSFLIGFDYQRPVFMATKDNIIGAKVGIATDDPQARLDIRLGDKQEIRIQSEVPNTFGGISFKHSDGSENWRIRAFSNFAGGYDNILSIVSSKNDNLWIAAGKTLIGDWFDFDPCTDCDEYKLFVKKGIRTEKVKVELAAGIWADYVFKSDYNLKPLEEVEAFINTNGHLPNVPSATEIEKEGLNLGEMDAKLLEKIEELTLYVIQLKKEVNELKSKK
ncbi:hypothetical protein IMCC3317_12510 [Kordia antarctica]|uniref:Trimeric autotransporter adhesin YadA-like head domain-containing protein n=1 Tax=Kordia antarctica TaxID=1218801 RepID=A0A7L4ZGR3_9FLAO|nr:hypothetical protein [Kordia antarctica]QHI35903.1 hypothetical protein IMCC3317_12510 [Kordia antarctica]